MINLSESQSLGTALWSALGRYAQNVALIESDRDQEIVRLTYADVKQIASQVSTALQFLGLYANKRAAIVMSNQSKWLLSATAVFWSGGVLVPIDYKLEPEDQIALLDHSQASFLIIESAIWTRWVKKGLKPHSHVRVILTESNQNADTMNTNQTLWETLAQTSVPANFHPAQRSREDLACIVYSSGTSGRPKGCQLAHGNYLHQAQVLADLFPIDESDRYFSILPTNHAIDFMCGFVLPLQFGAAIVHQRTLRPEYLTWTMQKYGITHMALVPMLLKAFENKLQEKISSLKGMKRNLLSGFVTLNKWITRKHPNHPVSSTLLKPIHKAFGGKLRLLFSGGAFVHQDTAQFFYDLGIPVIIGYGLTEAGTVVSVNQLNTLRTDTVGTAIPGTKIDVRNKNENGVGELWVSGPTVMQGYLDDEDLTNETIVDGWLKTGDLGLLTEDGHIKLVGRTKNMIVTPGGKNIYPEDVESVFGQIPQSAEHCVFSSNYIWQSLQLHEEGLVLVMRIQKDADRETIVERIRSKNRSLPEHKRIAKILFVENEFPKTASLKIKRELLANVLKSISNPNFIEVNA